MTLEQRAHDIGIAFATCKMNSRDNSNDDKMSIQTQFTNLLQITISQHQKSYPAAPKLPPYSKTEELTL